MFFLVIQIAFIIIAAIFIYKTAKENGYNAILWTAIAVLVYFGTQFLLGIIIGVVFALISMLTGWMPSSLFGFTLIVNLIALAGSAGAVLLILRYVNQIKDDEFVDAPPPPTDFNL